MVLRMEMVENWLVKEKKLAPMAVKKDMLNEK